MMTMQARYEEYSKLSLGSIEAELKDWFLHRRFAAERHLAIKQQLDQENFSGLSLNNNAVPAEQTTLFGDLVHGKPTLEESLSTNARVMKAELYLKTFHNATDLEHPCRIPGSSFLRCLGDNALGTSASRDAKCGNYFSAFDSCRKGLLSQQAQGLERSMMNQDIADRRAKALFERRSILLDTISS
eukprot:GEMP01091639.1.p1 GENE.GEMP01091639.1~~GEMP01091639.1.p1  ORF type:complete len:186 (+),score=55.45 GEMP01091639.1:242-799(+)